MKRVNSKLAAMGIIVAMSVAACSNQPVKIHYGSDECAHCRMMIMDNRFAAQMITEKGKAYKFDAVECLIAFEKSTQHGDEQITYWVSDFENAGSWLNATSAHFIKSNVFKTPMGAGLLALPDEESAENHLMENAGTKTNWQMLMQKNISQ